MSLVSSLQGNGSDVTIHDVSLTGLLIETSAELTVFDDLEIELPEAGFTPALVVWNSGRFYGCQFKTGISQAAVSAALLRSPHARPSDRELAIPLHPVQRGEAAIAEDLGTEDSAEEVKASLGVRLRVILGSAILLWALIIWAAVSVYHLVRGS